MQITLNLISEFKMGLKKRHFAMRYPVPGPRGPAGPKDGSVSTKTFNETQCARRATSSINSPCLVSYFGSNPKKGAK